MTHPTPPRRTAIYALALGLGVAACASDDAPASTDGEPAVTAAVVTDPSTTDPPASEPETSEPDASDDSTAPASDGRPGADIAVSANPNSTLSGIVTISADEPVAVRVTASSDDHVVELPQTAAAATDHEIPLVGMRSERDYEIVADLVGPDGAATESVRATFTTGAIPERFAPYEFSIDTERSSPGYTLIEMQSWLDVRNITPQEPFDAPQYLIALDDAGEIVWYYENGPVIGAVEQTDTGTFTSIYFANGVREFDILGNEVGDWAIPFREAQRGSFGNVTIGQTPTGADALEPTPIVVDDPPINLTHHEGYRLSSGNYLTLSTTTHPLTDEQQATFCPDETETFGVYSDVAVEFEPSGRVVRTWDLWDAIDVDETPGGEMCNAFFAVDGDRDWTHANAIVYDEQRDAVIFSSRHTNQIVAMRHLDDEGPQREVLWIFGDDGTIPLDGDPPYYPHAVEVQDDGSILLYDNGNNRPGTAPNDPDNPTYSRAVIYDVDDSSADPTDWTVTQTWEHITDDIDGGVVFAPFIGDADRVANGNVLITHGGIDFMDPTSFLHTRIIEVVPDGESGGDIVWQFDSGTPDAIVTTYRAERIESFYVGPDWVTD